MSRFLAQLVVLVVMGAATVSAANLRLYLKDGGYHMVKEYEVNGDRIRYLSTERDQWEQIPTAMVDLKRTEKEAKEREQQLSEELALQEEEDEARRKQRELLAKIPQNLGGYYISGEDVKQVPQGETVIEDSNMRKIFQLLSPGPIVASKIQVSLDGPTSDFVVEGNRPEFFIRLAKNERFGIVKLKVKDDKRLARTIEFVPQNPEEYYEDIVWVDIFRDQITDRLFRIWSQEPMEPGEYALIEYTDRENDTSLWPFRVDAR